MVTVRVAHRIDDLIIWILKEKTPKLSFQGFSRILVEMAGVEPASASTTLENTTCLDIVYCFNTKWPDEQGTRCDPLSLV